MTISILSQNFVSQPCLHDGWSASLNLQGWNFTYERISDLMANKYGTERLRLSNDFSSGGWSDGSTRFLTSSGIHFSWPGSVTSQFSKKANQKATKSEWPMRTLACRNFVRCRTTRRSTLLRWIYFWFFLFAPRKSHYFFYNCKQFYTITDERCIDLLSCLYLRLTDLPIWYR